MIHIHNQIYQVFQSIDWANAVKKLGKYFLYLKLNNKIKQKYF